ncbi:MAG: hypothetical protein LBO67_00260 [Spirochaetaceae bacterium]|jgi:hypothetical protein|nr:hypothetical protein [Spirochaetaceae bacterium]
MNTDTWKTLKPQESCWYCWHLLGAKAYLRKNKEQWQTAFETIPFQERSADYGGPFIGEGPGQEAPITGTWGEGMLATLRPYFSTKPYFVTVKERTRLLNGITVSFSVDLPPVLKFELPGDIVLAQAMPFSVSATWFGTDTTAGILCHSLPGALVPLGDTPLPAAPVPLIRSMITIKNHSKTTLDLDHLVIYPKQLAVYEQNGHLFSSILNLDFPGSSLRVDIPRAHDPNWNLLTPGVKSDLGELIVQWGIGMIKNLTQL